MTKTARTRSITVKVTEEEYLAYEVAAGTETVTEWGRRAMNDRANPVSRDQVILEAILMLQAVSLRTLQQLSPVDETAMDDQGVSPPLVNVKQIALETLTLRPALREQAIALLEARS